MRHTLARRSAAARSRRSRCGAGLPGLRVVRTGMGPRRSERAAPRLATRAGAAPSRWRASAVRCDDALRAGRLIVASALLGPGGERIEVDGVGASAGARKRRSARHTRARLRASRDLATDVGAPSCARTGACAVDMESIWLARAAAGRAFAVLRVVTDGPRHELWRPAIVPRASRRCADCALPRPCSSLGLPPRARRLRLLRPPHLPQPHCAAQLA